MEARRAGGADRGDVVGDGISAADRVPVRVEELGEGELEGLEFLLVGGVMEDMGLPLAHPHGGGEAHLEGAASARATAMHCWRFFSNTKLHEVLVTLTP